MNNTIDLMMKRCSLRKFKKEKITKEHLDILLSCAMRAPTAGNMAPYSIIIVNNEELKRKLAKSCDNQPFIEGASYLLVFVADFNKWYKYYECSNIAEHLKSKDLDFTAPECSNLFLATQDALIAAQNVVIAAESLGIGSCYIGDIMENFEYHRDILKLPKYTYPVTMLTLGYYDENHGKVFRERFDKKFMIFNDEYRELSADEIKEMFKEKDKLYVEKNKYGAKNYGQMHYFFKTKSDFAKEMNRSLSLALEEWDGKKIKKEEKEFEDL